MRQESRTLNPSRSLPSCLAPQRLLRRPARRKLTYRRYPNSRPNSNITITRTTIIFITICTTVKSSNSTSIIIITKCRLTRLRQHGARVPTWSSCPVRLVSSVPRRLGLAKAVPFSRPRLLPAVSAEARAASTRLARSFTTTAAWVAELTLVSVPSLRTIKRA